MATHPHASSRNARRESERDDELPRLNWSRRRVEPSEPRRDDDEPPLGAPHQWSRGKLLEAFLRLEPTVVELRAGHALTHVQDATALAVVHGFLVGRLRVDPASSAELLGPEDIVWRTESEDAPIDVSSTWTAISDARVAIGSTKTREFVVRYPQLGRAFLDAQSRRAEQARVHQAISTLVRIDDRVLAALRQLGDRFGRVTPSGLVVPVPLTQKLLGELIGARRPSVSVAAKRLTERGLLSRDPSGAWILHGAGRPERVAAGCAGVPPSE